MVGQVDAADAPGAEEHRLLALGPAHRLEQADAACRGHQARVERGMVGQRARVGGHQRRPYLSLRRLLSVLPITRASALRSACEVAAASSSSRSLAKLAKRASSR